MQALVLTDYRKLELQDVAQPTIQADEVLVRVAACGICGSDVHGYDGSSGRRRPPIIMGHEAAGTIAEVGSAVDRAKVGDRVTFDSTISCGKCDACQRGKVNLCSGRRVLGVSCADYRQHGAFAEFVTVPQNILYPLPRELPFEHAAMIEPVSVAVHAVERLLCAGLPSLCAGLPSLCAGLPSLCAGLPTPHQMPTEGLPSNNQQRPLLETANQSANQPARRNRAVVVGSGMIGLFVIQALRVAGCEEVIAIDVDDSRLKIATSLGANATINSCQTDPIAAVMELTGGVGADVAAEVVGNASALATAIGCTRLGGKIALIGNLATEVPFPLQDVVTRELTLVGNCASAGEYPRAIELVASGAIRVTPLINAVAPLADGPHWFERLYAREPGLMKVILQPPTA
jgi:L-iditol 2-dehydrogenase